MKIPEALGILKGANKDARPFDVLLACGFTPLHLQTFLTARLQLGFPDRYVGVTPGIYGNLADTLEQAADSAVQNIALVIEWADIDPRLGYRAASGWELSALSDVVSSANLAFDRLQNAIERVCQTAKVVVCPPTLPVPPLFHTTGWEAGQTELILQKLLAEFNLRIVEAGVSLVNSSRLVEESPQGQRLDLKSDLSAGLPYSLAHADAVALALCRLLCVPAVKKGLITDLDNTLWSGIVGEAGPESVHWDLTGHSHIHSLYQSLLTSLVDCGVLVAVASKNDPQVVQEAFGREDLLLRQERIFPMEVHWNAKSGSVSRILKAWNVSADAVVFVDDSPLELAEVAAAHPGIECIQFSAKDHSGTLANLRRIRDLFGKSKLSTEDGLRLESIRQAAQFESAASESLSENFLRNLKSTVQIEYDVAAGDTRTLELVNKTNQFNLNGIRYTESDWAAELALPDTTLLVASYEDRFGKLGKISAILGRFEGGLFQVNVWVMSCRAFARRIEFLCLRNLFEYCSCPISFKFEATTRNIPLQDFLAGLFGQTLGGQLILTREQFDEVSPPLYQVVKETRSAAING